MVWKKVEQILHLIISGKAVKRLKIVTGICQLNNMRDEDLER